MISAISETKKVMYNANGREKVRELNTIEIGRKKVEGFFASQVLAFSSLASSLFFLFNQVVFLQVDYSF